MPEVSVVIPTHNRASLLSEAIHSVLQQSYQDIEVIVVDDGSTDNTREQVATFQSDKRVRYIYQENKGLSGARNTGIRASNGNYIALLDDDDIWLPEKLEKQMKIMKFHEQADIVYCNFRFCDMEGKLLPMRYHRPPSRGSLYEDLIYGNVITGSGSAVLIKKKCIDEVGMFDESLLACEDQDLWRRMALTHHFVYIDEELLYIRWHSSNLQDDTKRMELAMLQYLNKLRLEIPRPFRHHIPEVTYLTYMQIVMSNLRKPKNFYKAIPMVFWISLMGPKYILRFALTATKALTRKLFSPLNKTVKKIVFSQKYLRGFYLSWNYQRKIASWEYKGKSFPVPHEVKEHIILEYSKKYNLNNFVETGTFLGDTIDAVRLDFSHVYSVELSMNLYIDAVRRFAGVKNISILQGDSGKVLQELIPKLHEPCLFWLDAHYSEGVTALGEKETPVVEELNAISHHAFKSKDIILIDDASGFSRGDHPPLEWIKDWAEKQAFDSYEVDSDIIRIYNKH